MNINKKVYNQVKLYKVKEYYREGDSVKVPIHYYMVFYRSLKTLFRWRWKITLYSETWFKRQMLNRDYILERYTWSDNMWKRSETN